LKEKSYTLLLSAAVTGATAISTQVILLREFLNVFHGNELVIGCILGIWMLFTGIGARACKNIRPSAQRLSFAFLLAGILPVLAVVFINQGRAYFFITGSSVSIFSLLWFTAITLLPFCLVTGGLFTLLCHEAGESILEKPVARIYTFESLGSFAGGIIFSLLFIFWLKTQYLLCFITLINLGLALCYTLIARRTVLIAMVGLIILLSITGLCILPFDKLVRDSFFKGQNVLLREESPYGNIVVTETAGQKNFYENGIPLFASNDPIEAEEAVHYALLQHPHPVKVLLVSGGISGQISEIMKYPVHRVDYVEMNPAVIRIGKLFHIIPEIQKLRCISRDPVIFIHETDQLYDAALIQVPEPSTIQVNRYFTLEFFISLKKKLNPGAVTSISLRSTADYVDEAGSKLNALLYNTLHTVFKEVVIVPGMKNYFIASDSMISLHLADKAAEKNIETLYVNGYYLDDALIEQRNAYIMNHLDKDAGVSTDFKPRAYFRQVQVWLSQFQTKVFLPLAILSVLLLVYLIRLRILETGLFFTGFIASSAELILLIAFQVMFGYVYLMSGIVISIFMAGLAAGSQWMPSLVKHRSFKTFSRVQMLIALGLLLLAAILTLVSTVFLYAWIIHVIFIIFTLMISSLTGLQFALASGMLNEGSARVASSLYSADLIGSAVGTLLVSTLLLPFAGITGVCFILAGMNILVSVFVNLKPRTLFK
jgi:spermidine synthase